jgi:hypothetical protein
MGNVSGAGRPSFTKPTTLNPKSNAPKRGKPKLTRDGSAKKAGAPKAADDKSGKLKVAAGKESSQKISSNKVSGKSAVKPLKNTSPVSASVKKNMSAGLSKGLDTIVAGAENENQSIKVQESPSQMSSVSAENFLDMAADLEQATSAGITSLSNAEELSTPQTVVAQESLQEKPETTTPSPEQSIEIRPSFMPPATTTSTMIGT